MNNTAHASCRGWISRVAILALLLAAAHAYARPVNGTLRLTEGDTLAAPDSPAFYTIGIRGLTVEGWFYIEEMPQSDHIMPFFGVPEAYAFALGFARDLRPLGGGHRADVPELYLDIRSAVGWRVMGRNSFSFRPNDAVGRWFHVAVQFHARGPDIGSYYIHGDRYRIEKPFRARMPYEFDGESALLIATPSGRDPAFTYFVHPDTRVTPWQGYIDNIRVSDMLRYDARGEVPQEGFRVDGRTIALWEFNEQAPYADSSGNGFHLQPGSTLAVGDQDKLTTTWAQLRTGSP